jgi:hypothetical protein
MYELLHPIYLIEGICVLCKFQMTLSDIRTLYGRGDTFFAGKSALDAHLHEGKTEEENSAYVVFKGNIHGSAWN